MAKLKATGYCPAAEIAAFPKLFPEHVSKKAEEVMKVLGKRANYMHYAGHEVNCGGSNACLMLMTTDTLAMDVAQTLKKMVSNEPIHDVGRVILVHDVLTPSSMPCVAVIPGTDTYTFMGNQDIKGIKLLQDDKFLVWIKSNLRFTEMYIYRKHQLK